MPNEHIIRIESVSSVQLIWLWDMVGDKLQLLRFGESESKLFANHIRVVRYEQTLIHDIGHSYPDKDTYLDIAHFL